MRKEDLLLMPFSTHVNFRCTIPVMNLDESSVFRKVYSVFAWSIYDCMIASRSRIGDSILQEVGIQERSILFPMAHKRCHNAVMPCPHDC